MIYSVVAFFLALALLTWSADRLVDGTVAAAAHSGMSPRLVGLLVGGFGAADVGGGGDVHRAAHVVDGGMDLVQQGVDLFAPAGRAGRLVRWTAHRALLR